jgi:hypothetical protein
LTGCAGSRLKNLWHNPVFETTDSGGATQGTARDVLGDNILSRLAYAFMVTPREGKIQAS